MGLSARDYLVAAGLAATALVLAAVVAVSIIHMRHRARRYAGRRLVAKIRRLRAALHKDTP